ncbi:microcystin-dependent protein [Sphingomonas sp. SORGH_AS802]|uniref:phage tail protein n=1 Tax=unclassified Sphingomonas TaxID=196159 RepID=UPI002866CB6B|nr:MULTISPECIES: tail fiber protein [unclassified Sphingomonas]MDR6129046.1 microcystin-dependent protein [Sphingomonas sp. SORGH_AS_0438]MDR6136492.1 microcystin-dependent protein [Sphingomonas sp. SORGH_AS_0802]
MLDPYLGEIAQGAWNFAPKGWAICDGSMLQVQQNVSLFSLLGSNFGGDGRLTFCLPNAAGRALIGTGKTLSGTTYTVGQEGGFETTKITTAQMPSHIHPPVTTSGTLTALSKVVPAQLSSAPSPNAFLANVADPDSGGNPAIYAPAGTTGTPINLAGIGAPATGAAGGDQRLSLMQPFLAVITVIAMTGTFPNRP